MRIAQVIHAVAPESGGPSVAVPALCQGLGAMGHDVRLHCTNFGGMPLMPAQASFELCLHPYLVGGGRQGVSPAMHRALCHEAKHAQIVHTNGLWLVTNLSAYAATKNQSCRVVLSPTGMLQPHAVAHKKLAKRALWGLWQHAAVRAAHCLHATSLGELEAIRSMNLTNPVALIPNGVDIPLAHARTTGDRRKLLFLGRLDPIKGVDNLVRAWAQIARDFSDWDLWMVGPSSGDYGEQMDTLAKSLRAERVHIVGAAFGAARDAHLVDADLLVLPTRSENFGMVVAEALAAGTPVICTKGAPWEGLDRKACGYWIEIGTEPLVACLKQALALPRQTLAEMGARGRAWMQESFAWHERASRLAEVYEWLVRGGTAPTTVACV